MSKERIFVSRELELFKCSSLFGRLFTNNNLIKFRNIEIDPQHGPLIITRLTIPMRSSVDVEWSVGYSNLPR